MTARTDIFDLGRYSPAYATGREFWVNWFRGLLEAGGQEQALQGLADGKNGKTHGKGMNAARQSYEHFSSMGFALSENPQRLGIVEHMKKKRAARCMGETIKARQKLSGGLELDSLKRVADNADGSAKDVRTDLCESLKSEFNKTQDNVTFADKLESARSLQDMERHADEHVLRKHYLRLSFYLVGFVIYSSLVIVALAGAKVLDLSPTVQIAMLTTMVANVIGILLTAMIWLYKNNGADNDYVVRRSKRKKRESENGG